ncbi:MAG: aminodeoxychorismate lyase, partial [Congregibacter sp.]|nr:aminodeoxychorismate lyase [Congregibacter sp.]
MAEQLADTLSATDRAFLYGDGVFETLLAVNGVALWAELHLERLMLGAGRLAIAVCRDDIVAAITNALRHCKETPSILRITVSRGEGLRGYAPSKDAGARITSSIHALGRDPFASLPDAVVATSAVVMAEQPLLAGLKHCNRLEQVLAAAEARDRDLDDVLLRRSDGSYQCSSNANIFVIKGSNLLTPSCEQCGVSGTRSRFIVETLAPKLGLTATRVTLQCADLKDADALFICNSVMGIRGIARWDDTSFAPSSVLARLH